MAQTMVGHLFWDVHVFVVVPARAHCTNAHASPVALFLYAATALRAMATGNNPTDLNVPLLPRRNNWSQALLLRTRAEDRPHTWHGQVGQDHTISGIFAHSHNGAARFFVDLAANRPITFSNTRALERDYGWRGLCLDGSEALVVALRHARSCAVVNAIVSNPARADLRAFMRKDGSGHGRAARPNLGRSAASGVPVTNLTSVLRAVEAPRVIDYLSLDCEGCEELAMSGLDLDHYVVRVLTVERPSPSLVAKLRARGFTYAFNHGSFGDQLWLHQTVPDGLDVALRVAKERYVKWTRATTSKLWSHARSGGKRPCGGPCNCCGMPAKWVATGQLPSPDGTERPCICTD